MFSILKPRGHPGDPCVNRFSATEWSTSCAEGYCPEGGRMCSACTLYEFAKLGESCTLARACDGQVAFCDGPEGSGSGRCSLLKKGGAPCTEDRECASSQCRGDGGCLPHGLPPGAPCMDNQECASFECASGRCFDSSDAGTDLPVGSACTVSRECGVSTACTSGRCSALPGEGMTCPPGEFSFACADGLRCDRDGVCHRQGLAGEPCNVYEEGYISCRRFLECDAQGRCSAGSRLGEVCDGRTGCSEGFCRLAELEGVEALVGVCSPNWLCRLPDGGFGSGVCVPLLPPGAPCLFAMSCAEGFCPLGGGTCPLPCLQ
jgi:hypothetical protein